MVDRVYGPRAGVVRDRYTADRLAAASAAAGSSGDDFSPKNFRRMAGALWREKW
jgi:hypothetical protein